MIKSPSNGNTSPRERAALEPGADTAGQTGEDRREDQQRDAVADAALRDQLAHPHEQRRASGERDDQQDNPTSSQLKRTVAVEEERETRGLDGGQAYRRVSRVLVDLRVARLALFLKLLEPRNYHGHQLHDDRRRDVGH